MKYFVVTNEHGSAWNESRSLMEQEGWAEHAAFMNKLVDEDFIVLGGPLGDGSRTLLVINTDTESTIRTRLAADPWTRMGLLRIGKIEPWEILLGNTS